MKIDAKVDIFDFKFLLRKKKNINLKTDVTEQ